MAEPKATKRSHRATFASDKKNPGHYLVRVVGPHATAFSGREVPVTLMSGDENVVKLVKAVWAGVDTGTPDMPGTGFPVALYKIEEKPREKEPDFDF